MAAEAGATVLALVAEAVIFRVRDTGLDPLAVSLMCVGGLLYSRLPLPGTLGYLAGLSVSFAVSPSQIALSVYVPLATVAFRAQQGARRQALLLTVAGLSASLWASRRATKPSQWAVTVILWLVFYGLAWLLGHTLWRVANQMRATHALELAAQRRTIAAELHDNVAHELTLMVLRAESARRAPETAVQELQAIARAGRHANEQLRQMMRLLQVDEAVRPHSLRDALDTARADAALHARRLNIRVEGRLEAVDEGVGDCLARVLKEVTNNMVRHADPSYPCAVFLRIDAQRVQLAARNRRAAPWRSAGRGLGLDGMAERVTTLGGRFWAGPQGDMWLVRVDLPAGG